MEKAFELQEFVRRRENFQQFMEKNDLAFIILDQPEIVSYVAGYAMSEGLYQFCILPRSGNPKMFIRHIDVGTCEVHATMVDMVGFSDWENPLEKACRYILESKTESNKIGVDKSSYGLTVNRFFEWQKRLKDVEFIDCETFFSAQRSIKSSCEMEHLKKASEIADEALARLIRKIKVGISARECVAEVSKEIISLGGDAGVVGPVTKGLNENSMHALVDDEPLREGDVLHVELIPFYLGYGARIMRPVHIGKPTQELNAIAEKIVAIQDKQLKAMRPGAKAGDIDEILRKELIESGLREKIPGITGYSLGYYQLHTARSSDFTFIFRPGEEWVLEKGMVFHMYAVAKGMAFSETVSVTDEGGVRLTKTPRALLLAGV